MLTIRQLEEFAQYIEGSCGIWDIENLNTIVGHTANSNEYDQAMAFLEQQNINCCETCGWWGYADEFGPGDNCDQCQDDIDNNEE